MISSDNLCMSCMREIGEEKQCPYCGYRVDSVQLPPYLPVRTVIANRYLVGKLFERNGEGASYIGWDLSEKKAVKIREFIPDSFTSRASSNLTLQVMRGDEAVFNELRQSFEELWTKLARLKGLSALISVTNVVEDYGSSYAVYDHFEGTTLREYLLGSKTGYIPWEKARQLFMPILSTLGTLHSSGIIHRGISPSTLIIDAEGRIKISGFCIGAARSARSDLYSELFDGYAAIEQYGFEGSQGPWTDIYAFGATLYRALIGSDPMSAAERMANDRLMVPGKFAEALPAYVVNGLINALQILPEDRTRSVEQLRAELSASPSAASLSDDYRRRAARRPPAASSPARRSARPRGKNGGKRGRSDSRVIFSAALSSLAIGAVVFAVLSFSFFRDRFSFVRPNSSGGEIISSRTEARLIPVPNFIERSFVDIGSNPVFKQNFNFEPKYVNDDVVAEGYIIDQSVKPDERVPKGTTITLFVSVGKEEIPLPNVVGVNYDEAAARLTELGFVCEKIPVDVGSYKENEIVSMAPLAEKTYEKGTKVYLKTFVSSTLSVSSARGEAPSESE